MSPTLPGPARRHACRLAVLAHPTADDDAIAAMVPCSVAVVQRVRRSMRSRGGLLVGRPIGGGRS